ncbi:MAG: SCO1664 family protein [Dehalococcoidia bacterium]
MNASSLPPAEVCAILQHGEIVGHQPVRGGWNANFLLQIDGGTSSACTAIYKPQRGEAHLWDYPPGTLFQREYLAYWVNQALGWDLVPPTVIRDGPHGLGSVQLFVETKAGRHFFNLAEEHKEAMIQIVVFDCLINNADRKGGHVLLDTRGHIWGIDHGLSFTAEPKLRTVMWDFSDEPVPQAYRDRVRQLLDDGDLRAEVTPYLNGQEVEALYERAACLLTSPTIPMERYADRVLRPYPWPPI